MGMDLEKNHQNEPEISSGFFSYLNKFCYNEKNMNLFSISKCFQFLLTEDKASCLVQNLNAMRRGIIDSEGT